MHAKFKILLTVMCLTSLLLGCNSDSKSSATSIVPQVKTIENSKGELKLSSVLAINTTVQDPLVNAAVTQFEQFVVNYSSFKVEIDGQATEQVTNQATGISLILEPDFQGSLEAYQLDVMEEGFTIQANNSTGLYYGLQSLKQLLLNDVNDGEISLLTITDEPQFGYRGLMLDVSRHFYTVEEVKQLLDLMALYKLNKFHWHLTDDNGWRVEIKSYPLLTEIGSYRDESQVGKNDDPFIGDGIPHYGFYTQEQIKDIVAYATQRHIEVIPEIDMPGHVVASLAAYPELACRPGPYKVSGRWGIHKDIYCPNEATFTFIETVLMEIASLFPSQYIHVGGDEVPTTRWQQSDFAQSFIQENNLANEEALQGYFFERINETLVSLGKKAVVWDETIERSISSKPVVMAWRGMEWAEQAIEAEHEVILAVKDYSYFDYYQGDHDSEPLAQCCLLTLSDVYNTPTSLIGSGKVLGGQAQLWTAFINDFSHLQYMLLPRMLAHAEVYWTEESQKNYSDFEERLASHELFFEQANINYRQR